MIYLLEKSFNGSRFYDDEKVDSMTKWVSIEGSALNVIPHDPRERMKIKILRKEPNILDFVDVGWRIVLSQGNTSIVLTEITIQFAWEVKPYIQKIKDTIKEGNILLELSVFDLLERKWNTVYKRLYKNISQKLYDIVDSEKILTDSLGVLNIIAPVLKLDYPLSFICVNKNRTQYYALLENPSGWNLTEVELKDIKAVDEGEEPLQFLFKGNRNKFLLSVIGRPSINGYKVGVKPVNEFTGENAIKGNLYVHNFLKNVEVIK